MKDPRKTKRARKAAKLQEQERQRRFEQERRSMIQLGDLCPNCGFGKKFIDSDLVDGGWTHHCQSCLETWRSDWS